MELLPTDELLRQATNKFFIVSLPRTGTKSLCKMFLLMGYRINHCPSVRLSHALRYNEFDCFADTPIYRPSLIKQLTIEPTNRFIYIDRSFEEWIKSFESMNLHMAYTDYMSRDLNNLKPVSRMDRESLLEIFGGGSYSSQLAKDSFYKHQQQMFEIIPTSQLLVYQFQHGWSSLCDFVEKEIPSHDVPHLNNKVLFDKII